MAITLGGISLPDGTGTQGCLIWPDQYAWASAAIAPRRGVDGNLHVFTGTRDGGRPITLEARARVCWLSQSQVDTLYVLADAGGELALVWGSDSYTVRFAAPLDITPVQPFSGYYTGTIPLMEVQ